MGRVFVTTRWSVVLRAGGASPEQAQAALEQLCREYWYPLYAFVRRKGHDSETSRDLVQGFLASLLESGGLEKVGPERGRFRSFLMAACSHYLSHQRERDRALKRGGGHSALSLDTLDAERRYRLELADDATPERLFLRRWATTLLDLVLDRLTREQTEAGKGATFEALKPALLGDDAASYRDLGARVGLNEGTARVATHRLRARYRTLLREEIARTLADPSEEAVAEELNDLFAALAN